MSSFKIIAQDMFSSRRITKTVRAVSEEQALHTIAAELQKPTFTPFTSRKYDTAAFNMELSAAPY